MRELKVKGTGRITAAVARARARSPFLPRRLLRAFLTLRLVVAETLRGFRADRGVALASSLAFATLLTSVPLLATFSLLLAAFFRENIGGILDVINAVLPYHTARVTNNLREFVAESTAISGVGLALLLVASIRLIYTIEGAFNAVWGAPKRRRFLPRVALYTLALFVLTLLVGSAGLGIRMLRHSTFSPGPTSNAVEFIFPLAIEFVALTLLYRFLPNARVRWSAAAVAGAMVAVLLELLRDLFGLYVQALSRVNLITGSLTLILLTLLSILFVWVLILLGVELTHVLQTQIGQRGGRQGAGGAETAIRILLKLVQGGTHAVNELSGNPEASTAEAEKILDCLRQKGLVEGDARRGFKLIRSPERITVAQVVEAIAPDVYAISPEGEDRVAVVLQPLFQRLDAERRALLGVTIAELAEE